jgi:alpha-D-ribose 1-methylphosphonate 5-triphosphate synthase subunit PhnI
MKLLVVITALFSLSAQAHFKLGTYKGLTLEGAECAVKFESVSFTTAFKNPLSERVAVSVQDKSFVLQHTAKVDATSIMFNEGSLEATIPLQGGAEFFKVIMLESDVKEGPDSFVHMIHNWKTNEVIKINCENLNFQAE